jgi:RNA polymerase-binding protein DksA
MSDAIEGGTMPSTKEPRQGRSSSRLGVRKKVRAVSRKTKRTIKHVAQAAPNIQQVQATATNMAENLQVVLQKLLAEMQRVKAEIAEHARLAQERSTSGNDIGDDGNEIEQVSKNLALKRHLERLLAQIEAAVSRIEQGVYGLCERCGQAINPERLEALPYATTCLNCARAAA